MIDFKQKLEEKERLEKREQGVWQDENIIPNNRKRKKIITYIVAIAIIAVIFSGRVIMSSQNSTDWLPGSNFFNKLRRLVPSADRQLQGEDADRINILLLGMGGEGHDGAYLTDTIMLASLKPSTKQVALVSIPRDLSAPINGSGWRKINNINAYAEAKEKGSGGEATVEALSDLLQIPIHYYVRVDFNGFVEVIDELGGIEVNIENTLDDYTYPIKGEEDNPNYYARFEHLHFDQGWQKMDGELALKYVRSRHALGIEGSDFARARRQQIVLEAVKEKLLSRQTLLNPVTIGKLINEFNKNVATNLNIWEMLRLWDLFKNVNREQITNEVLSDAPDSFLVASQGSDGAFILIPRSGNFSAIRKMVQTILDSEEPAQSPEIKTINDQAKVTINNGTWITGLAGKTAVMLEKYNFEIVKTGNAPERTYEQSVIYDLTYGRKNESLEILKQATGAIQLFDSPNWLKEYRTNDTNQPDFLLILGTEANE